MYEILAEVTSYSIPGPWSIRSIFSFIGILYMAILGVYWIYCKVKYGHLIFAWLTTFAVGAISLVLIQLNSPSSNWDGYYKQYGENIGELNISEADLRSGLRILVKDHNGEYVNEVSYVMSDRMNNLARFHQDDGQLDAALDRMEDTQIYAMHHPTMGSVNPWIWHPACLVWCPFTYCLPGFILFLVLRSMFRR